MKTFFLYLFGLLTMCSFSQESLSELLQKHNTKQVPYISVEQLAMPKTNPVVLDARESQEYKVSHLKNAIHVGYDRFNIETVEMLIPDKDQHIVVYCSLGIRSEVIANKLKKAGYTHVKNLYGGIFEWKNKNFSVYNTQEKETDSIHAFSKDWSKWLNNGIKIYE
ncbi:rhodanese-like domain-containing protein [Psychroserpens mesophilus]|uniref:rhodanese-like domain-containing protein n=1 Tax=Psychroserpens mesophilus TaxID=325473 RepID=UPI003D65F7AC